MTWLCRDDDHALETGGGARAGSCSHALGSGGTRRCVALSGWGASPGWFGGRFLPRARRHCLHARLMLSFPRVPAEARDDTVHLILQGPLHDRWLEGALGLNGLGLKIVVILY